jgi:hypothetical protein
MVLFIGRHWPRHYQRGVAAVVLVWTLLPGPVSPAFWLGLAFQMPSLMSSLLCLTACVHLMRDTPANSWTEGMRFALRCAGLAGALLGWVLLLDTFAALPFSTSVYALGFSPLAVLIAVLLASLPWVLGSAGAPGRAVSYGLWAVLLLYVLWRLPTGNLWDVVLDPWLWFFVQIDLLLLGFRWLKARWAGSTATRA